MASPKLLVVDIEWRPTKAYVWEAWGVNITSEKVIEHGGLLCVGAKWVDGDSFLFSEWEHGHQEMVEKTHALMSEADAVITYNGDKFDLKKLDGEFLLAGLAPIPPVTSIDLLKHVRKFGFFQNGLKFIGPFLKLGTKLEHEGFDLWIKVEKGDTVAQKKMARYCSQDVTLTEKLYKRIKPFIKNHPHLGESAAEECGSCGSKNSQKRGFTRTKMYKTQRIQCTDCGSWRQGERTKI